jgi:Malectin domain/Fibronectin type III domain
VVLGLGYADLVPQTGTAAITVADVGGVQLAGFLIDAGPVNSPVLLQIGVKGASRVSHASNPTSISDVHFRIGGATAGTCTVATEIDSDNVIIDNMWSWRADHGTDAAWTGNVAMNGLVVNGDNVIALGLAVEHYEAEQVVWNGEGGETIFYQSEMPYDVPSQSAWMNGSVDGYASYNVAPTVATHTAYGLGVYSFFEEGVDIIANSGIAAPVADGVTFHDAVTVFLSGSGQITHTLASNNDSTDNAGTVAESGAATSFVTTWGGTNGSCGSAPGTPGTPSATGTSSSTINVTWSASSEGSNCTLSYNLFRSTTSGFTPSSSNMIASDLTAAAFADSGLAAGTTYYYVEQAVDADGTSANSAQGSGATTGGGSCSADPSAPTNLVATASSSSVIGLTWTAVTPPANCTVSSYSVYRSTTNGFTPGSGTLIASGVTTPSYSNTGLAASTTYYYKVEALDSFGASPASAQAQATTQSGGSGGDFIAINFEGPAESNSGGGDAPFAADEDFSGGGAATPTTHSISTTAAGANAAPMAVYQTQRDGTFTYTIPGMVPNSQHIVLLHFAEIYFTAAGDREYNVAINGTNVLTNFDQFAAAGGKDIAVVKTFTATANSSGQIVIAFTDGAVNQPSVAGLEIR